MTRGKRSVPNLLRNMGVRSPKRGFTKAFSSSRRTGIGGEQRADAAAFLAGRRAMPKRKTFGPQGSGMFPYGGRNQRG